MATGHCQDVSNPKMYHRLLTISDLILEYPVTYIQLKKPATAVLKCI